MELQAGQRWLLTNEDKFLVLDAGKVEVYAVTREGRDYRQVFLLSLDTGKAIFPVFVPGFSVFLTKRYGIL